MRVSEILTLVLGYVLLALVQCFGADKPGSRIDFAVKIIVVFIRGLPLLIEAARFETLDQLLLVLLELLLPLLLLAFHYLLLAVNLLFGDVDDFLQQGFRSAAFVIGGVPFGEQTNLVLDTEQSAVGKQQILACLRFAVGPSANLAGQDVISVEGFVETARGIHVFALLILEFLGVIVAYEFS